MTTQGMVFVTGATGFLGRSLVARLLAAGYGVRVLVRPGSDTRFLSHTGVEQVLAHDITDAAALQQGCAGCQAVVHAAALFRMWGLLPVFWQTNVAGGRHVTFPAFAPDVAQAIVLALTHARPGHIYNISGESLDHNSINNIISDLAGIGRWRIGVPVPAVLALARTMTLLARYTGREPFYPINFAHYVFQDWPVSSAKAEAELGFRATPFAEGARQTLEWYWSTGQLARRRPAS